jgi:hypothetical protein
MLKLKHLTLQKLVLKVWWSQGNIDPTHVLYNIGKLHNTENLGSDSKLSVSIVDFNDIQVNIQLYV